MNNILLEKKLNEYLTTDDFNDLCPNGLQVEGKADIKKIVSGVSASVELFEKAIEQGADAIIVHHGIIWDFEKPLYRGGYKKRIKLLLENEINLYAWHLPLDAHPEVGNNAVLSRLLGLQNVMPFGGYKGQLIGMRGNLENVDKKDFIQSIKVYINPDALVFDYGPDKINSVGIVSGGAHKNVTDAVKQQIDLFITGEVSEHILHYVKEERINFIAAGHYATERFGIKALGEYIEAHFGIETEFIEIPNPV